MGCDIHQKLFVFSKVENKMVPATSITSDGSVRYFPEIVGDRDYNLFGLFGNSARSYYPELDCFEGYEWPDFMNGTTFMKRVDNCDYHTRRWCKLENLRKSLCEYKERLNDPFKFKEYYDSEDDLVLDAVEGKISKKDFANFHSDVLNSIEETINRIDEVVSWLDDFSEIVDPQNAVLVTWMDS